MGEWTGREGGQEVRMDNKGGWTERDSGQEGKMDRK